MMELEQFEVFWTKPDFCCRYCPLTSRAAELLCTPRHEGLSARVEGSTLGRKLEGGVKKTRSTRGNLHVAFLTS